MRYTRRRSNADEKIKNVFTGRWRDLEMNESRWREMHDRLLFVTIKTLDMPAYFSTQRSPPTPYYSSTISILLADSLWSLLPQFFPSSPSSPWSQQLQLSSKNSTYSIHLFSYQTQNQSGNVVRSKLLNGELVFFFFLPGGCESVFLLLPFYSWHIRDPFII